MNRFEAVKMYSFDQVVCEICSMSSPVHDGDIEYLFEAMQVVLTSLERMMEMFADNHGCPQRLPGIPRLTPDSLQ